MRPDRRLYCVATLPETLSRPIRSLSPVSPIHRPRRSLGCGGPFHASPTRTPVRLSMIDHITLRVRDLAAAKAFYTKPPSPRSATGWAWSSQTAPAWAPAASSTSGWSTIPRPGRSTWPSRPPTGPPSTPSMPPRSPPVAPTTALPGVRTEYHPNYYAAFVFDPSGHNIEMVHHQPPGAAKKPARGACARKKRPKGSREEGDGRQEAEGQGPKGLAEADDRRAQGVSGRRRRERKIRAIGLEGSDRAAMNLPSRSRSSSPAAAPEGPWPTSPTSTCTRSTRCSTAPSASRTCSPRSRRRG